MSEPLPQSKRFPWLWVILGCGSLVLVTFVGCVAGSIFIGSRVYRETQKPVVESEVLEGLGDIPVYEPSQLDPAQTRALRASTVFVPGAIDKVHHAAFTTPDSREEVVSWYKTQLSNQGYELSSNNTQIGDLLSQFHFQKGRNFLLLQLQPPSQEHEGGVMFTLSHYQVAQIIQE